MRINKYMSKICNKVPIIVTSVILSMIVSLIITLTVIQPKSDKYSEPINKQQSTETKSCRHDWYVLSTNNDSDTCLVACKKCGELILVDHKNSRIKSVTNE